MSFKMLLRPNNRSLVRCFESLESRRLLAAFSVTELSDAGPGSLRAAIELANNTFEADEIDIVSVGVIRLESQLPKIRGALSITGPGRDALTIDAGNGADRVAATGDGHRIFEIDDGSQFATLDVQLKGMTLTGGDTVGDGGAIKSAELLKLVDVRLAGNAALTSGGAISARGSLTLEGSLLDGNRARLHGGGISARGGLVLTQSRITGSAAGQLGGGLYLTYGTATFTDSTIDRNTAGESGGGMAFWGYAALSGTAVDHNVSALQGGGIFASGSLTLAFSSLSDNAARDGGGLYASGGLSVKSSSISGNKATARGGGVLHYNVGEPFDMSSSVISGNSAGDHGGGLYLWSQLAPRTFTVGHSTIVENSSQRGGGGVMLSSGRLALDHVLLAKNSAAVGPDLTGLIGATLSSTFSLIGDGANSGLSEAPLGSPDMQGNLIGGPAHGFIDPRLGTSGQNGGAGASYALRPDSPALNAGRPGVVAGQDGVPTFDGRGFFQRVADGRIDIGAYERQSLPAMSLVVDTLSDVTNGDYSPGNLSLREAIGLSNGNVSTVESITFATALTAERPGVIELLQGELGVTDSVKMAGAGSTRLTIDASPSDPTPDKKNGDGARVLHIDDANFRGDVEVEVADLTLTGGDVSGRGGAIYSREKLTVLRSRITGNAATDGGGIFAFGAGGQLHIDSSTIEHNLATNVGGGASAVVYEGGRVTIENSTISNNRALDPRSYNVMRGGGLYLYLSVLAHVAEIRSTTVSGNEAGGEGGGVYFGGGYLNVDNSTVTGNFSGGRGGGIGTQGGSQGIWFDHTIVAQNRSVYYESHDIAARSNLSFSLVGDGTGAQPTQTDGSLVGTSIDPIDPLLGPLAHNGGLTATHALLPGSPALNAGNPDFGVQPSQDQRGQGFARIGEGRVDIGAYEAQVGPSADFTADGVVDGADFLAWQRGLGTSNAALPAGDSDGDLDVDASDLAAWRGSYGAGAAVAAVVARLLRDDTALAMPEPFEAKDLAIVSLFSGVTGARPIGRSALRRVAFVPAVASFGPVEKAARFETISDASLGGTHALPQQRTTRSDGPDESLSSLQTLAFVPLAATRSAASTSRSR